MYFEFEVLRHSVCFFKYSLRSGRVKIYLHCVIDHWVEVAHCVAQRWLLCEDKSSKVKYENDKVYLQVEPHGHDWEDDGGVDEVREGDGEDERSGCLE